MKKETKIPEIFGSFFSFSEVTIAKGGYAKGHNHEHDQSLYQNKRS